MKEFEFCIKVKILPDGRVSIIQCSFPKKIEGKCSGIIVNAETAVKLIENAKFMLEEEIEKIKKITRFGYRWR